jgi:aspartyl-tRNA(Asn)/glutamyl-tRNA(Gln) amidotransferase subunit C
MKITEETIVKTAKLAHLELTPDEVKLYTKQLSDLLAFVSKLDAVKTEGVAPLVTPTEMAPTLRSDEIATLESATFENATASALENAPERSGSLFRVPPVL